MKKKLMAGLLMILMLLQMPALAAGIVMRGYTDSNACGVTLLLTQKGTELSDIQDGQILWIDQEPVKADGGFVLTVPLLVDTEYDLYTNASSYNFTEDATVTLYVSANGDDNNSGETEQAPLKTLAAAHEKAALEKEIILLDDAIYTDAPEEYQEGLTIRGKTGTETLTLPTQVSLKGTLKLDHLKLSGASTVYANGYALEIGETVTSTDRMQVFGGKKNAVCKSTDLRLYGGLYTVIYGGGDGGAVTEETQVTVGGSVNAGDGINDDASNISPCYVYGGGKNAAVHGSTNITLTGNAVSYYLVGAGTGTNGTATDTNINIQGGKVMNVYGGSQSVPLSNCNTHITMTGGVAESLFGGCSSVSMTGNTYITVKGGEVLRRIYTGCYNDADALFSVTWADTDNHVIGTTNLILYPEAKLTTKTGLSFTNTVNSGVFCGSRRAQGSDDEVNTLIFADGSYSSLNGKMGEHGPMFTSSFKSFQNYTVNAGTGGQVLPTSAGKVKLEFGIGMAAVASGTRYFRKPEIALTKDEVCAVSFEGISSAELTKTQTGVDATVGITNRTTGQLVAAIYEDGNTMVACRLATLDEATQTYTLNLGADLKQGSTYRVKIFLWEDFSNANPLTQEYSLEVR